MNKILKLLTAVFSINFFVMPLAYQHNLLNNNITDWNGKGFLDKFYVE